MKLASLLFFICIDLAFSQAPGSQKQEYHLPLTIKECPTSSCNNVQAKVVIDSNWRWIHDSNGYGYTNCYTGIL